MVVITLLLLAGCSERTLAHQDAASEAQAGLSASSPTSVLLILMDDMRADDLWAMPWVQESLSASSLSFERAYVNTPVCCPTRASIAAGGFRSQSTGVLTNDLPNGSAYFFDDSRALAVTLQDAGYRTGFVGKYLHGQPPRVVPPGWSSWVMPIVEEDWSDYRVARGSSTVAGDGPATIETSSTYLADYIGEQSEDFLDGLGEDEPFFLWVNHWAPHYPATPHEDDVGAYEGVLHRPDSYNEEDVDDKPRYVKVSEQLDAGEMSELDDYYQQAMESLLAADRSIQSLVERIDAHGRLDDTVIIFTSDNGYLYGEHRLTAKGAPYEASVRVPLLISAPGGATGSDERLVDISIDIGATIQRMAGLSADSEGESLVPVLEGRDPPGRSRLLIEAFEGLHIPTWSAAVTTRYKLVEYAGGQQELYDLKIDPDELVSRHGTAGLSGTRAGLSSWLADNRGLSLKTIRVQMRYDRPESTYIEAWGGTPPYSFTAPSSMPDGLTLDSDGRLWGRPSVSGTYTIPITVTGSGTRRHSGDLETFHRNVKVEIEDSSGSSSFTAGRRETISTWSDGLSVEVPAPKGFPVYVTLSPMGDFADGLRVQALGPDAHVVFDDLRPGTRYRVLVEGPYGDEIHDLRLPD